jgi:HEAT repeat protein
MLIPSAVRQQHSAEATLLARFVAGDPAAVDALLRRLSSSDHASLEPVLEVIGHDADLVLWQRLLHLLAFHQLADCPDSQSPTDAETLQRTHAALVDLFLKDDDPPAVMRLKSAALSEGLTDQEPGIRHMAAALLGLQGDRRAINVLIEAATTGTRDCRLKAIAALGQLKAERGSMALVEALASDEEDVHWAASQALNALQAAAFPALIRILKAPKPHVRWHAVCGLGTIGDARAAGNLADALFDDDFSVRSAAAEALSKLGTPAVSDILRRIAHRSLSQDVCQAAYHALQQLVPCVGRDRLQPLLDVLRGRNAPIEAAPLAEQLLQTLEEPDAAPGTADQ